MKILMSFLIVLCLAFVSCVKSMANEDDPGVNNFVIHSRNLGESAKELLSDRDYRSLTIEIQYMSGFAPQDETVSNLKKFMQTFLRKPGGISVSLKEIDTIEKKSLTVNDVISIENNSRTQFAKKSNHTIFVLFTNGFHADNRILGMAYRNTSAVLFGKAIQINSNVEGKLTRAELETAVLLHEMGHLLGLGNKSSDPHKDHLDKKHGNHCANPKCLMFYSTETKKLSVVLRKGNVPELDADCRRDLLKNGGRNSELSFPHH